MIPKKTNTAYKRFLKYYKKEMPEDIKIRRRENLNMQVWEYFVYLELV